MMKKHISSINDKHRTISKVNISNYILRYIKGKYIATTDVPV